MRWWTWLLEKLFGVHKKGINVDNTALFDVDYSRLAPGPVTRQSNLNPAVVLGKDKETIVCDSKELAHQKGCTLGFTVLDHEKPRRVEEVYVGMLRKVEIGDEVGALTRIEPPEGAHVAFLNAPNPEEKQYYACFLVVEDEGVSRGRPIIIDPRILNDPIPDDPPV